MASKKNQAKAVAAATRLLGGGTPVRAYVRGRASARMTTPVIVIMAIFGVLFVGTLVTAGKLLIPGFFLIYLLVSMITPLRGVAATDRGIAVFVLSKWNAQPIRVLTVVPVEVLARGQQAGKKVQLHFGPEYVRLRQKDYESLTSIITLVPVGATPSVSSAAPGWYPVSNNPAHQAYWDGSSWLAAKRWDGVAWVDA